MMIFRLVESGEEQIRRTLRSHPKWAPAHVHRCPGCYQAFPCGLNCTIEPDLTLDNGMPAGSYVKCRKCAAEG